MPLGATVYPQLDLQNVSMPRPPSAKMQTKKKVSELLLRGGGARGLSGLPQEMTRSEASKSL